MIAVLLAALALGPPVIHEPFTPLPCPKHPETTFDLEACGVHKVLKTDRAINVRATAIFGRLRTTAAKKPFVQSEREWLRYRRASCSAQASEYAGGTAEPVAFIECEASRNRRHLADLAELERALGPH